MAPAIRSAPTKSRQPARKQSFGQLQDKALTALRKSGFADDEVGQLESMLDSANERNLIFTQLLLTSMKMAGVPGSDIGRLGELFQIAHDNIAAGSKALTEAQEKELVDIFARNKVSYHLTRRVQLSVENNEVLAQQIADSLFEFGKGTLGAVPKKS
jgi:hypothetical protein